jgi:hypothetical protein
MAGIDLLGAFPKSRMAKAVKLGQSRFRSSEDVTVAGDFSAAPSATTGSNITANGSAGATKTGVFTENGAATLTTAQLLTAAGLTAQFNSLSIFVKTSTSGITIAQGAGNTNAAAGSTTNLTGPISATQNSVTLTLAAGDVVQLTYSGT